MMFVATFFFFFSFKHRWDLCLHLLPSGPAHGQCRGFAGCATATCTQRNLALCFYNWLLKWWCFSGGKPHHHWNVNHQASLAWKGSSICDACWGVANPFFPFLPSPALWPCLKEAFSSHQLSQRALAEVTGHPSESWEISTAPLKNHHAKPWQKIRALQPCWHA